MWIYQGKDFLQSDIQDYVGFVYQIHNTTKDKKYIGKKEFWKTIKRKPLKGKTRKRICKVPSNWEVYTGSSKTLNYDIENGDKIVKEILLLLTSKSSMAYFELKKQLEVDAFFKENYYNQILNVRLNSICVPNIIKDLNSQKH